MWSVHGTSCARHVMPLSGPNGRRRSVADRCGYLLYYVGNHRAVERVHPPLGIGLAAPVFFRCIGSVFAGQRRKVSLALIRSESPPFETQSRNQNKDERHGTCSKYDWLAGGERQKRYNDSGNPKEHQYVNIYAEQSLGETTSRLALGISSAFLKSCRAPGVLKSYRRTLAHEGRLGSSLKELPPFLLLTTTARP